MSLLFFILFQVKDVKGVLFFILFSILSQEYSQGFSLRLRLRSWRHKFASPLHDDLRKKKVGIRGYNNVL